MEHWNGSTWSIVASPEGSLSYNSLNGVAAISSSDVRAVGSYAPADSEHYALIEHWDGNSWTLVPESDLAGSLSGVAAVSGSDVWVVGYSRGTLTLRYNPCTASPTPTPTTSCSVEFTDVLPGSTFYDYVHCLGVVSGYGDGTFGPNNSVTRGQLAKIISNSVGYSEEPTSNTFQDVATGSTFFLYVERLYMDMAWSHTGICMWWHGGAVCAAR